MDNDRELLELAAKAAGMTDATWEDMRGWGEVRYGLSEAMWSRALGDYWNPLVQDGDALQLVVDLRLKVLPGKHPGDGCTVETQRPGIPGCSAFDDDKRKQARRAIVVAAAEIGRAQARPVEEKEGESRG